MTLLSDEQVALASTVLVALLFAVSVVAALVRYVESGAGTLPASAAYVFLTAVVAYGVVADVLTEPVVQVALWFGVVAVGVQQFLTDAGLVTLVVVAVGLVALAEQARRAVGSQRRTERL